MVWLCESGFNDVQGSQARPGHLTVKEEAVYNVMWKARDSGGLTSPSTNRSEAERRASDLPARPKRERRDVSAANSTAVPQFVVIIVIPVPIALAEDIADGIQLSAETIVFIL